MALEVGSVYARAGFRYDDDGADRFERRLRDLRGSTARPVEAHGRMNVDGSSFSNYERKVDTARAKSKAPVTTHGRMNVDSAGFNRYDERLAAARAHSQKFGSGLAAAGLGGRAALLGVQGAAVGAAAAVAGIVFAGARFEQKMKAVKSVTGANAQQMRDLSKAAVDLGTSTGLGAGKAADAITELAKGGLSASQILKGGLKGALALAAAGNLELADAASGTANALNLFALDGSKATHVADAFATAANATTADVGDFTLALSQGGAAAKAAGLSFDQTVVALEALAANGVKGSDAGTSLKSALTQIAAPTNKAADLMDQLGLKFFDAHGKMKGLSDISEMLRARLGGMTRQQRLQAVTTIAGTDGMRALLALYDTGPRRLDKFTEGVKRHGSAAHAAKVQNEGLAGGGKRLLASFEAIGIELSKNLNPKLNTAARALARFVDQMRKNQGAGGEFRRTMSDVGKVLHVVAIAIGGAFRAVFGTIRNVVSGIKTGFSGIAGIFKGVAKVISSIVHGDIRGALNGLGGIVRGAFRLMLGALKIMTAPFRAAFSAVFKGLGSIARGAFGTVTSVVRSVLRFLTGAASTLLGILSDVAHAASGLPIVGGAFKGIARTIDDAKDSIDRYRDSLKKTNKEHRTTQRDVSNARDDVEKWRKRVASAKKGSDEHRQAVAKLNAAHRKYLRTLLDTQGPAKRGAKNIGWIGKAAHGAAGVVADSGDNIAKNLGQLAKDLGAKGPRFKAAMPKLRDVISPFARGGFTARAGGGYTIGQPGDAGPDTVPLMVDPRGAILTRHHDAALGLASGGPRPRGAGGAPAGGPLVGVMAGSGETYVSPDEVPMYDALARAQGYGGLAGLFASVTRPHYMARGGFVHVPGDPSGTGGRDRVAASIAPLVSQWVRRYHADIGYAYDPGGGHKSPGHNVTGTATDVYPGPGGSWDLLERGLRALSKAGYTIYYGTHGIGTPLEGHGRGNHAHIEWGSGGHGIGAAAHLGKFKLTGPDGSLKRVVRAALDRMTGQANTWLDRQGGGGGGPDSGGGYSVDAMAKLWVQAGGPRRIAHLMGAIGKAESGGRPSIVNSIGATGLWQILWPSWRGTFPGMNPKNALDNARMAVHIYREQGLGAWEAYTRGMHRQFLGRGGFLRRGAGGFLSRARGGFLRAATGLFPTGSGKLESDVYTGSPAEIRAYENRTTYKFDPLGANPEALRKQLNKTAGLYGTDRKTIGDLGTRYSALERRFGTSEEVLVDETTGKVNTGAVSKRAGELRQLLRIREEVLRRLRAARKRALAVMRLYRRMRHRAYGIIRTIKGAKGPGAPKLRARMRALIKSYNKKLGEWKGRVKELGDTNTPGSAIYDADTDRIEAANALAEVTGTKPTPQDPTDPTGAGDGTGTPSPLDVATAALAQVSAFNAGRTDLFSTFGNNFTAAGQNPFAGLGAVAGVKAFGAASPSDPGPSIGVGGGGRSGVTQYITFTGPQPAEPHPWVQASMHEASAALAGQAGGI